MEIRTAVGGQDHDDLAAEPTARRRSRPLPGVSAALSRPLHGAGLAHWGGPAPGGKTPKPTVPVDVAGTGRPGRLPDTD